MSKFMETFIVFRKLNHKTIAQSSLKRNIYSFITEVRGKKVDELADLTKHKLQEEYRFDSFDDLGLKTQNKGFIHFILARITNHIENKCGINSHFDKYLNQPSQIEHILCDSYGKCGTNFSDEAEYDKQRNLLGALLILPESFNKSYGNDTYSEKLPRYFGQNLLAQTLNKQCYSNNPNFLRYKNESGINFEHFDNFGPTEIKKRHSLYKNIIDEIYRL